MASYSENSKTSGNAKPGRPLKRMKLVFKNTSIQFAVNPEDFSQKEPHKANLTQTKGGAWIDTWGAGIIEFSIKGTTGVKGNSADIDTGYQRWKELRNLIREVYEEVSDGAAITEYIKFYNFTDNEYWYCYPSQSGIELYRSKSRPNIYQYNIGLWGIRKIGNPSDNTGVIGNPNSIRANTSSSAVTSKQKTDDSSDTKSKDLTILSEECDELYKKLAPLIGGSLETPPKIVPATGFQCTNGLNVQSSGHVSNVSSFTQADLKYFNNDFATRNMKFTPKLSVETYELYTKMKDCSPDVLSTRFSSKSGNAKTKVTSGIASKTYNSTIYSYLAEYQSKSILTKMEINWIKVIMLESMMVWMELFEIYKQAKAGAPSITTTLTVSNIERLITNIYSVILRFSVDNTWMSEGVKDTTMHSQEKTQLNYELRELERIFTKVKVDILNYL